MDTEQEAREAQEWAACDPFALVSAARNAIHSDPLSGLEPAVRKPLEEVISRFELLTRASLGSKAVDIETVSGGGSQRR